MTFDDIVWKLKADRDGYNEQQDEEAVMDKELYQATFRGQTSFLSDGAHDDTYFTRKTSEVGGNIIHIAVQQEKLEFASEGARRFPKLICEGNCDNNTPLHFAAKTGNLNIMKRLIDSYMDFVNKSKLVDVIPWRVKNKEGNTPLHVALARGEISIAEHLLEVAPKLARIRNNLMEMPLHLAVKYNSNFRRAVDTLKVEVQVQRQFVTLKDYPKQVKEDSLGIISPLMRTEPSVACWRDTNGVTPLLQAILLNPPHLAAVEVILDWCPQSASVRDSTTGNTILHYLIIGCRFISNYVPDFHLKFDLPDLFCRFSEIAGLKDAQNFVGDTPSHIAVNKESDVSLRLLMNVKADLTIENRDGVYVADLILQNPKFKSHLKHARRWFKFNDYTFVDGNIIKSHKFNKPEWRRQIRWAIDEVNLSFLREMLNDSSGLDHLMRYSVIDSNILHDLLLHYKDDQERVSYDDFLNVVKQVSEALPFMFCQTDDDDQNLLHVMAAWLPKMIDESMLELSRKCVEKLEIEAGIATICSPPWKGLDIDGDTPLHILIDFESSIEIVHQVKVFICFDSTLAECTNNDGMTPLHMLCEFESEDLATILPYLQRLNGNLSELDDDTTMSNNTLEYVIRKGPEDKRKLSDIIDLEREDECGICLEPCSKIVLPNFCHSMCISCYRDWNLRSESCPFCRGSIKRVNSADLWVLTGRSDVVDRKTVMKEDILRLYLYISSLPKDVPDAVFLVYYEYLM